MKTELTPVVEFMTLVYKHSNGGPHSWRKINNAIYKSLMSAAAVMRWQEGDLAAVPSIGGGKITYAFVEGWMDRIYSIAVANENTSLIEEWERHHQWSPVIADHVTHGRWECSQLPVRQRDRLAVGSHFPWQGRTAYCTSIVTGGVRCCTYPGDKPSGKPDRVLFLTAADIQADRKARKATAKATTLKEIQ